MEWTLLMEGSEGDSDSDADSGLDAESAEGESASSAVAEPEEEVEAKPSRGGNGDGPGRYAVMLHNDPVNSFEFVVYTLVKVLRIDTTAAMRMTDTAHTKGKCAVWKGMLEPAEFKAQQITAAGPDPLAVMSVGDAALPLKTTVEKVAGD